jgi:hypothetical protein
MRNIITTSCTGRIGRIQLQLGTVKDHAHQIPERIWYVTVLQILDLRFQIFRAIVYICSPFLAGIQLPIGNLK